MKMYSYTENEIKKGQAAPDLFHLIVHLEIHVHLSYILVGDAIYFQIDQNIRRRS